MSSASCARIEIGISKRVGKAGMLMLPKIIYGNLANLWTESDTPKLTYIVQRRFNSEFFLDSTESFGFSNGYFPHTETRRSVK